MFNAENFFELTAGGAYTLKVLAIDTAGNQNITTYTLTVPGDSSVSYKLLDTQASEVFILHKVVLLLGQQKFTKLHIQ